MGKDIKNIYKEFLDIANQHKTTEKEMCNR